MVIQVASALMHSPSSSSSLGGHMDISVDANPLIGSQDEAASGQHISDSVIAHVTEAQFTQGADLEMDSLSQLANDELHDPHMNAITDSESIVHESVTPGTNSQSVRHLVKYVGRLDVEKEEHPCAFAFAQAPKATLNLARRIGQSQASHLHSAVAEKPIPAGSQLVPDGEQTESKALLLSRNKAAQSIDLESDDGKRELQIQQEPGPMALPTRIVQETIATAIPSLQGMGLDLGQRNPEAVVDLTEELPSMQHVSSDGQGQNHFTPSNGNHGILRVWGDPSHTSNDSRQSQPGLYLQQPLSHSLQSHPAVKTGPSNSTEPPETPWTPSRVTKTKKKPKVSRTLQNSVAQAQSNTVGSEPSPEDLLTVLLFRARQDKKARDLAKAVQQAKEAELEDISNAYALLRTQMQELSQRDNAKQTELVKYQKALPGWKTKIRRLEDYVKGLTNDHHNLRDDGNIIQRQQKSLEIDRTEITASIKEILIGAKQHIVRLERRVEEQEIRHEENVDRLETERARNNKLEQDVSGIAESQQQIEGLLCTQRQAMTEKLDELLNKPLAAESISSDFQKHTWEMLDRVLGLLTEIKAMDNTNPDHLLRIDETITSFAGQLGDSLQQLIGASKSSQSIQLKLKRNMHKQMEDLRVHITKEQSLAEQVTDLRESKAAITERLQGNETALAEARQVTVGLQAREQSLSNEVMGLRAEVTNLRARTTEEQAMKSRLHQSEIRNLEIEAEVAQLLSSLSLQADLLEQSNAKVTELQDNAGSLKAQLNEGKTRASKLEEEKAACEVQANAKYESLRSQLLNAANAERNILATEQSTVLLQLQRKKEASESKVKKLEEEVKELRVARAREVESSIQTHSDMEVLQAQIRENDQQLVVTRETLRLTEEDLQSKSAENQVLKANDLSRDRQLAEVEARLVLVTAESTSRDDEITRKINEAGQSLNLNMEEYSSFENALNALLEMLVESAKPEPASAEPHELPYGQASQSQNACTRMADHESQELPYNQRSSASTPKKAFNEIDALGRCSSRGDQGQLAIQEVQIEETTYHRNFTTTRSTHAIDSALMLNGTPCRVSKTSFSRFNGRPHQIDSESPMLDTTGLFPPTPIPPSNNGETRVGISTPGRAQALNHNGVTIPHTNGEVPAAQSALAMPRSILKPPRRGKRRLSGSFLWSPVQSSPKRRQSTVERQGLGPIIPDSHNSNQGVETKANTKARKSTRQGTDKFTRHFNHAE